MDDAAHLELAEPSETGVARVRVAGLVPGVLALAVMSSAMVSLGIGTGFDRRFGVLKRLGSTPLGRPGLLVAKTLYVLAIEVIQIAVLLAVAVAIGWEPSGGLPLAVVFLLVGTIAFALAAWVLTS